MSKQLLRALQETARPDGPAYIATSQKHADKTDEAREFYVRQDLIKHIGDALDRETFSQRRAKMMLRHGAGGISFSMSAARILYRWFQEEGAIGSVRRIKAICRKEQAEGIHIVALTAPTIDKLVRLTPRINLLPFEDLPESPQRDRIWQRQFNFDFGMTPPPVAALVAPTTIKPLFYSDNEDVIEAEKLSDQFADFESVRHCLALLGPTAPLRVSGWFQFTDKALNELSGASSVSYPSLPASMPSQLASMPPFEPRRARNIITKFFSLERHDRERVKRALERFVQARSRRLPGDAAIDLSIALESLVGDIGSPGEHTWKIGFRSALLSEKQLGPRCKVRSVIKNVYNIRSEVMHDGIISRKHKKDAVKYVQEGILSCARVISNVISRGGLPRDWSAFELSGGK
jgi:hypothetical protein